MLSTVSNLMTGVFGSRNQRLLKRYGALVGRRRMRSSRSSRRSSDEQLRAKTPSSRSATPAQKDLDALLPEAFAVVREAAKRTLEACATSTCS